jgi:hypothetical protein
MIVKVGRHLKVKVELQPDFLHMEIMHHCVSLLLNA